MTVQLTADEAREIAALLEKWARLDEATYGNLTPEADLSMKYAKELRGKAGPPLDPILNWVEQHEHRFTVPDGMDAEDVAREIQQTIAEFPEGEQ